MVQLTETTSRLEIASPMPTGLRWVLGIAGLLPLYAPYDLLLQPDWNGYFNVFFAFAALISAGAMAVSFGFIYGAVAGLNSRLVLDGARSELIHSTAAPVIRKRTRVLPLSAIERAEVGTQESENGPTYHLALTLADGTTLESGSISSRDEAEAYLRRVTGFLKWHLPPARKGP